MKLADSHLTSITRSGWTTRISSRGVTMSLDGKLGVGIISCPDVLPGL